MEIVGFTLKHDARPVFDKIAVNLKAPNHQVFTLKWGPSKQGIIVTHEKSGTLYLPMSSISHLEIIEEPRKRPGRKPKSIKVRNNGAPETAAQA